MKVGRLPSAGITQLPRYLCAPPTSRLPNSAFGCPYTEPLQSSPATDEISRVSQCSFPPHAVPTTPESPSASLGYSTDGTGLPHLTTGSALSISKSRGSMGSLVVRPAGL